MGVWVCVSAGGTRGLGHSHFSGQGRMSYKSVTCYCSSFSKASLALLRSETLLIPTNLDSSPCKPLILSAASNDE